MKKDSEYIKFLFIGLCVFIFIQFFSFIIPPRISQGINDLSSWYLYSFSKKSLKPFKYICIGIDEYSLNKIHQRYPWKRSVYAQIIKILDKEKVDTIGFDFAFVGESEDKEEDRLLREALKSVTSRVVLAYFFDFKKGIPVLPLAEFKEAAYSLGMLNTPIDNDGKVRRLRGYLDLKDNFYYSFSLALSAAFLKQQPKDLILKLPISGDQTLSINYLLKPKDIIKLSFYDVLTNLEELKERYGNNFLNGALVLVYPEAEILHDTYNTPLGKMPGGILQLNGVANIILGRFIKEVNILSIVLLILSFIFIFFILSYCGFVAGALLTLGVIFINFWILVLLGLKGIKFNYAQVTIFSFLFFLIGSIYKYIYFLGQILKIKDKATLDPLRKTFTLRYFYYRLGLETRKIYFRKELFLVFIFLESFKETIEDAPFDKIKDIWQKISSKLSLRRGFWSVYSQDELVGCLVRQKKDIDQDVRLLKENLDKLFLTNALKCKIKLAYLKFNKKYPARELLPILSAALKAQDKDEVFYEDIELANLLSSSVSGQTKSDKFLESFDEDIEDRNKEFLSLIDNLNREHAKTKEAFFEIITSLVNALEARDAYTEGHSERVSDYALMLAEKLNWPKEQLEKLKKAALLHDLGKIGIPDSILHKRGSLDNEEFDFIKKHEIIGVRILEPLKELSDILPWILHHHEKWDGSGYPHGLAGEAIPLAAQIISLADVFDALTTGRDYKKALSYDEAIQEIVKNKGKQFNPQLVDIFVGLMRNKISS